MEKLAIIAAISAIPSIIFMLVAKITGNNKWIAWLFIKFPSLVSLIVLIIMALVHFGLVKIS